MVFNSTFSFNNISVISWWSVLVEETGENQRPVADKLYHIRLYRVHLAMNGVRAHNLSTDCTGSCKSNYHTMIKITTTTAPGIYTFMGIRNTEFKYILIILVNFLLHHFTGLDSTSKSVAPRPASENLGKPQVTKPIEQSVDKGRNVTTVNVPRNRTSTESTDFVLTSGTTKGVNSNLQVQKSNLPAKTPPACKFKNFICTEPFQDRLFVIDRYLVYTD